MPEAVRPRFQQLQYAFAAHLRDPARHPSLAGVEDRRMAIYRELFFNNVEGFLAGAFPVLRRLTPDARWLELVRRFYADHRCHTPLFHRVAEEFLHWLHEERAPQPEDPPFLAELAHYEWVELALGVAEESPTPLHADPNGDLLAGVPVLSPLAWPQAYEYPVHRIGPDFQPAQPPAAPTYLVVYRTRQDEVKFLEINAITARLLELLAEAPESGAILLKKIAAELQAPDAAGLLQSGGEMLRGLRARDIVLGTQRPA